VAVASLVAFIAGYCAQTFGDGIAHISQDNSLGKGDTGKLTANELANAHAAAA
jgi:hypothetical protein